MKYPPSIDPFLDRDSETARDEARLNALARFSPPAVVFPLKPDLFDKLKERFDFGKSVVHGGNVLVREKATNEQKVFVWSVDGCVSATCWMVGRMGGGE